MMNSSDHQGDDQGSVVSYKLQIFFGGEYAAYFYVKATTAVLPLLKICD
jgi:hypothetical protein